jgi:hypothetical protein
MCRHREAITQFVEYFRSHIGDLDAVLPLLYRKILYATALDPLARAAFGTIDGHRQRIIRLIDELIIWDDKHRVSLPQLSLALEAKSHTSSRLYQDVRQRLVHWAPGAVVRLMESPLLSELKPLADPAEDHLLTAARYVELFYTYRNNLIHEFREPGYGIEIPTDENEPYYHGLIDNPWQLVFPIGFFACLFREALSGLESFLMRADIDPYSQFEFGSLWRAR